MLSRREQLQLWLQRKKSGKKGLLKRIKKSRKEIRIELFEDKAYRRRENQGDATNRLVQKKKEQSKQNRRKSLCNISKHSSIIVCGIVEETDRDIEETDKDVRNSNRGREPRRHEEET